MEEELVLMPKNQEALLNLEETCKAISNSRPMQEHVGPPVRKSRSADFGASKIGYDEHGIGIKLKRENNFNRKVESARGNFSRMRARSAQFSVDINGLVHHCSGSLKEIEHVICRTPSTDFGLLNPIAGPIFPSPNLLELSRKNPYKDEAVDESPISYKKGLVPEIWEQMQMEPTLPIYLKFSDVSYQILVKVGKSPSATKYILKGVTGSVFPGEVLALMGPSGGGKTTLLNLLSGRVNIKGHGGIITYNDQPYSKWLKKRIGFVLQDDVVFPHLTVRETLTYAALLRLPKTLTKQQKEERAMNVISELGLESCQDMIIGGPLVRGISGGERKRVCIGNEILLDPSLIFLDEPTSGLDSTTALRITQMLHKMAHAGKTVVTTIHQPSSRLFNKFDKLILLGKGSSFYFGKASEAMLYFSSIGCSPLIAMNPAEFLIDLANGNMNDKSIPSELKDTFLHGSQEFKHQEQRPSPVDIHEYLLDSYETRVAQIEKQKLLRPVPIDTIRDMQVGSSLKNSGATWWQQYYILFWRGLKQRCHDYLCWIRVTQVLATAVIVGLLWWRPDASTPKKIQDQAGVLFFISVFWGFFPVFTAIFTFSQERALLVKEMSVNMYKLSAYFMARNMSDLPLDLILPIMFLLIVYFMVGLKPDFTVFLLSMLTIVLSIIAAQGLGLAIGAALMDVKKATTLASVIIMTFMLAGGFFVQRVPFFMSWIRYLSFNYHTYRLLLKIQYSCSSLDNSGNSPCNSTFIKGLRLHNGGMEAGAMIAMIFGYRLLAYIFLKKMRLRSASCL
ncbi:ABC transporter G family member 22 isoform X2 [Elaeis guineensis]|nr:ABC transporter G family member 22 isoform X2 [Elaeis guineensis]